MLGFGYVFNGMIALALSLAIWHISPLKSPRSPRLVHKGRRHLRCTICLSQCTSLWTSISGINATVERGATSGEVERPQLTLSDHESLSGDALQIVGSGEKEDGPREAAAPYRDQEPCFRFELVKRLQLAETPHQMTLMRK